ncbi:helix-turn-helix transcriptional regulator [Proteiniclasticum sp.]|uniref:helix-turn-helix domain-containing protein n=1 Tax=Proteiniclasticum sp. TaxID=2053595 RepID=UPI0028A23863|nr:helix-turn-helix transcriptional regulator [Proteiniclasticum sp.]
MTEINKKEVGLRIKTIRQERGMTQEEFGKLFNASKGNISLWENGSVLPNNERLKIIADLGSIAVNDLLYGHQHNNLYNQNFTKALVYTYPSFKAKNYSIMINYKISLFFETNSNIVEGKSGSFILTIEISCNKSDSKIFTLNCRYSPSDNTKVHTLFIQPQPVIHNNANISDPNIYYDHYSKQFGLEFYENLKEAIKKAIEEYIEIISDIPLTVDIDL